MGLAITIGNVVSPVIIGRDFRGRAATVTGSYTAALNVGTMITLSATGPLVDAFGWQIALAVWAVLPLLAAVVWVPLAGASGPRAASAGKRPIRRRRAGTGQAEPHRRPGCRRCSAGPPPGC